MMFEEIRLLTNQILRTVITAASALLSFINQENSGLVTVLRGVGAGMDISRPGTAGFLLGLSAAGWSKL
jgi:uncharacterized membrane protein